MLFVLFSSLSYSILWSFKKSSSVYLPNKPSSLHDSFCDTSPILLITLFILFSVIYIETTSIKIWEAVLNFTLPFQVDSFSFNSSFPLTYRFFFLALPVHDCKKNKVLPFGLQFLHKYCHQTEGDQATAKFAIEIYWVNSNIHPMNRDVVL